MRRFLRIFLRVVLGLVVLVLIAGGFLWWKLRPRVESIPTQLAAVNDLDRVAQIRLPGDGELPELVLGKLRGQTAYFVLESRESMKAREGRELSRALDRWVYPEGVLGFSIGEAEGLGLLKWQIDKFIGFMRRESRLPLYMDYEGAILRGFKLPKGHTGVIVLGPDGDVRFRHTGKVETQDIEALRLILGANEPPPPPPAPTFAAGAISSESCRGKACVLVFLARAVSKKEVPGIKGGAKPDNAAAWADASLRLVAMLVEEKLPEGRAAGVFVGDVGDVPLGDGWSQASDDGAARTALGVPPGEAALVVVDAQGRLALHEIGNLPLWKASRLGDLLGLDAS
jgi:hypothetical protein